MTREATLWTSGARRESFRLPYDALSTIETARPASSLVAASALAKLTISVTGLRGVKPISTISFSPASSTTERFMREGSASSGEMDCWSTAILEGVLIEDAPSTREVCGDVVSILRERHRSRDLVFSSKTNLPMWDGSPMNLGMAIDGLRAKAPPRAT